jgi:RNA polymerase-binding transcription factor DksA
MVSRAIVLKGCFYEVATGLRQRLPECGKRTYGNCISCGNEIDRQRLDIVLWSNLCIVCHEESEPWQGGESAP